MSPEDDVGPQVFVITWWLHTQHVGRQQCSAAAASARRINSALTAPSAVARHCRAKIGGAAGPATLAVSDSGRRHVSPLPRHHAWRGTGIWLRLSVRFKNKKRPVLDLELVYKKC